MVVGRCCGVAVGAGGGGGAFHPKSVMNSRRSEPCSARVGGCL